ncbi:hypothetical protein [Nostoc sp.]
MQIRLAAQVASKVEGIRQSLEYSKLSDTVNVLLDAVRQRWTLKLSYLPQSGAVSQKVRLDKRHHVWVSRYATDRGINATSATNLLISEYLAGNTVTLSPDKQEVAFVEPSLIPQAQKPETTDSKPKGQQLIRGLKL